VGHGIGASLVAKLLADRKTLCDNSRLRRLRAAFLISGEYDVNLSPLDDNFDHLWKPGTRVYVFAGQNDEPESRAQSRRMYDRIADSCDMCDMHYEIKDKKNRRDLLEEICKPNSFLGRLIRYDIGLSQTR
jgi:hypothetical protein